MDISILVNLTYIAASILFIVGLKMLGSPETARQGNLLSASGMLLAVVITLLDQNIIDYRYIVFYRLFFMFFHCISPTS